MKRTSSILFLLLCFSMSVTLELTTVSGTSPPTMIRIDNPEPQADALFGRATDGIGDIDGDGIGDLAIGASGADRIYILSGIDHSIIHIIEDPDDLSGYRFGYAVCGVGDLDGDGIEDVAIGAPGPAGVLPLPPNPLDPQPRPEWGRVFAFSGATGGLILRLLPDVVLYPAVFGASIASLGDVNGDEISDIVVGAPLLLSGFGSVWAYSGHDGSLIWERLEPSPSPEDWGQEIASFGYYLADIDDLTGDGRRDLLVAAPFHDCDPDPDDYLLAGKAYVLDGSDGTIFRTHENPAPAHHNLFGVSPGAVGDQDGDGVEDYAFGETGAAIVHLFSGASGSLIADINNPSGVSTDFFGFQIAGDGDRDADGLNDFWVAAPREGIVYLMNSVGDVLDQVNDPNPDFAGEEEGFGWRVSLTEDLDGDGTPDLIIGKPRESVDGFGRAGVVFLVLSDTEPPTIVVEIPSEGQTVQDGVTLTATVSDPSGVEWTKFSIREPNGELGTTIDPMFESMSANQVGDDTWELLFDTTQLLDGCYLLLANASDTLGNEGNVVVEFCVQNWACLELLPASKSNKGGRTMPVKFSLRVAEAVDPAQPFVWNNQLTIAIYEEGHPESILQESTYGDTARDYRIDLVGELYITNFRTLKRPTAYVVEIYRKDMLVGYFDFSTVK